MSHHFKLILSTMSVNNPHSDPGGLHDDLIHHLVITLVNLGHFAKAISMHSCDVISWILLLTNLGPLKCHFTHHQKCRQTWDNVARETTYDGRS
jgi:hypothetical protein